MTFASKKDYQKYIEHIHNITSYIDYFSDDSHIFGEWKTNSSLPSIQYSKEVESFIKDLYDNGFITDFDWTKWEPAEKIFKNHKLIKSLELLDIEFLLTTIIRKERFCEGVLMNAIDNGMILSILEQCRFLVNPEGELLYQEFIEEEQTVSNKIDNYKVIELNEFYITGMEYYQAKDIDFSHIDFLSLYLEPDNEYDINAIELFHNDMKIGYIPKEENSLIAKIMQQSVNIIAKIVEYNKEAVSAKKLKVKLYQDGMIEVLTMKDLMEEHRTVFGVEPYIIGMFWSDSEEIINGISKAIETKKPYNEYLMLSEEERKAFDNGDLLF